MERELIISIVVPVYNRPDEMKELLQSLAQQTDNNFELIVVEDGSSLSSESVVREYEGVIDVRYLSKPNTGAGDSRNHGSALVRGRYIIYLDSDCVAPPQYIEILNNYLKNSGVYLFGGPDAASDDFSNFQKAVNYSMTSFFTTGGIRGGKRKVVKFYPRSCNMGYSKEAYDKFGGFTRMRTGEDVELGYRIDRAGYPPELISEAFVYHKRRSTLKSFRRQVFYFGLARINLSIRYPKSLKLVHILPLLFVLYIVATLAASVVVSPYALAPIALLMMVWFLDSSMRSKNIVVGGISIVSSFVQLFSYGCGLFYGVWMRHILRRTEADTYK